MQDDLKSLVDNCDGSGGTERAVSVMVVTVVHHLAKIILAGLLILSEDSQTCQRPAVLITVLWYQ